MWSLSGQTTAFYFYPRPPRGGRQEQASRVSCTVNFYPRPPRGGRLGWWPTSATSSVISIHALREEGDAETIKFCWICMDFYPRPPRGGRPLHEEMHLMDLYDFYPRPPRGGRRMMGLCVITSNGISIHALREEGDKDPDRVRAPWEISIHALREEGDCCHSFGIGGLRYFYPRPPRGGRLHPDRRCHPDDVISIHALREEGDMAGPLYPRHPGHFYPRPPRGGRLILLVNPQDYYEFLSTPSARRATGVGTAEAAKILISIHALREEGDLPSAAEASLPRYFYPRPPRGGRPRSLPRGRGALSISIHALREEGDV